MIPELSVPSESYLWTIFACIFMISTCKWKGLHKDYHLGESIFASFFCLIHSHVSQHQLWSQFWLFLDYGSVKSKVLGHLSWFLLRKRGYVPPLFPTLPHALDTPFHSGTGRILPLPREHTKWSLHFTLVVRRPRSKKSLAHESFSFLVSHFPRL